MIKHVINKTIIKPFKQFPINYGRNQNGKDKEQRNINFTKLFQQKKQIEK